MRVGIVSFMHESNTFLLQPTLQQHFANDLLLEGEVIRDRLASSHHEIGGFFAGLESESIEAVPLFAARAIPYGPIEARTFEQLSHQLLECVQHGGQLDGLLVALHGAAVSEAAADADGELLSRIRSVSGATKPLIVTLDAHANLSASMVSHCNGLVVYRTNPHVDQRERGYEAAQLMARALRREVRPVVRAAFPPLVINIERQCTSEAHWQSTQELAEEIRGRPGILSVSIVLGFPYSDVVEMGASTIVVADGDEQLAQSAAAELANAMWQQREAFVGQYVSIDDAIARARKLPGPVCLLDMGDNVGGGSPADGTYLTAALANAEISAFACLYDPESVQQAIAAESGGTFRLAVGGKSDALHGPPLVDTFRLVGVFDGRFEETQVRHGGARHFDQGPTAVVKNERGLTLMLTSRRMPPFSLQQLLSCGILPADFQVLVAKGVNAPLAAYREVCRQFIRVDTPGSTTANLARLTFHHRRHPLFPFEPL